MQARCFSIAGGDDMFQDSSIRRDCLAITGRVQGRQIENGDRFFGWCFRGDVFHRSHPLPDFNKVYVLWRCSTAKRRRHRPWTRLQTRLLERDQKICRRTLTSTYWSSESRPPYGAPCYHSHWELFAFHLAWSACVSGSVVDRVSVNRYINCAVCVRMDGAVVLDSRAVNL